MRRILAALPIVFLFSAAASLGAEEEVDLVRLQREVGPLLADYERGLRPRISSLKRDGYALGVLREGIKRVSPFQRDFSLEQARNKVAEARAFLEKEGSLSEVAARSLGRVDDILRPPVVSEPAEKTKARLLAALEPFQTDLLQRATVLNAEANTLRRFAAQLSGLDAQARGELPEVFRAFLDLSKIAIENEADAGR